MHEEVEPGGERVDLEFKTLEMGCLLVLLRPPALTGTLSGSFIIFALW